MRQEEKTQPYFATAINAVASGSTYRPRDLESRTSLGRRDLGLPEPPRGIGANVYSFSLRTKACGL